jgi:hypothetical protein
VTLGQIVPKRVQDTSESQAFSGKAPRQRSPAHAELSSDYAHLRFAVRQEHSDRILNRHT